MDDAINLLFHAEVQYKNADNNAYHSRRPLDHKKFLDMLIDDTEEKFIELVEGTRAHTSNIDNYLQRICTALDDDLNTQFYFPAFRYIRETSTFHDVQVGQVQTETILTNNREFAKVSPQATMEFDLPKRDIVIKEAFDSALATYNDFGALMSDPNFLALTKMYGGQPTSSPYGGGYPAPMVRDVLPGLPSGSDESLLAMGGGQTPQLASQLEALIPDPAIYKFETGTGFEIRPVIQPDGQAVVFHLNYMYTTNIREPVRADEKHLGRIKRHFIDTDVQLGNFELREVSRYQVALKASRTARGVPLLEDAPVIGGLFRPLPQDESALQQNVILSQATIFPTLFDLMGLRWATAVADLDSLKLREEEFVTRNRELQLRNEVFDYSSLQVDDFMRIPEGERRGDLYRPQYTIPHQHPNNYQGPGLNLQQGVLMEQKGMHFPQNSPYINSNSGQIPLPDQLQPNVPYQNMPMEIHQVPDSYYVPGPECPLPNHPETPPQTGSLQKPGLIELPSPNLQSTHIKQLQPQHRSVIQTQGVKNSPTQNNYVPPAKIKVYSDPKTINSTTPRGIPLNEPKGKAVINTISNHQPKMPESKKQDQETQKKFRLFSMPNKN